MVSRRQDIESPFTLVAQICSNGSKDRPLEDIVSFQGNAAWVLDGATGFGPSIMDGYPSDANWLVNRASAIIKDSLDRGIELQTALLTATRMLRDEYLAMRTQAYLVANNLAPVAAGVFVRSGPRRLLEFTSFGDCVALVRNQSGRIFKFGGDDQGRYEERIEAETFIQNAMAGASLDVRLSQHELHTSKFERRRTQNTSGGTWLLGTVLEAVSHFRKEFLTDQGKSDILLMTDGFYALVDVYGAVSDDGLFDAAVDKGLDFVLDQIRTIENNDKDIRRYARHKVSDDASALLLRTAP